MRNAILMKNRLLTLVTGAVLTIVAAPLLVAPSPAAATTPTWTHEDPSFPFRWAPCQPIPYRVNLQGTPHRNLKVVRAALRKVAKATGFHFQYVGASGALPYARGRTALEQVPTGGLTIAWATPRQVPSLAGNVVGVGGPGSSYRRLGDDWEIDSGAVVIDRTARLTARMVKGPSLMSLMLHELGHAMGLGHSNSEKDAMYEGLGRWSRPHLGPGDRAGLRALGAGSASCS